MYVYIYNIVGVNRLGYVETQELDINTPNVALHDDCNAIARSVYIEEKEKMTSQFYSYIPFSSPVTIN